MNNKTPPPDATGSGISRRRFLQRSTATAGSLWLGGLAVGARRAVGQAPPASPAGMNVILFLTDQERAIQHFPPGWSERNLPGLTRLQRHGITFENAFTNACMCSPARSTLMTGYFPAQHGVKYTLEENMPAARVPAGRAPDPRRPAEPRDGDGGRGLQRRLQGQVALLQAGRRPAWSPSDLAAVRLHALEPARRRRQPEHPGGGRRPSRTTTAASWTRSATSRPATRACCSTSRSERGSAAAVLHGHLAGQPARRPLLPERTSAGGLRRSWLEGDIGLPATVDEDLSTQAERAGGIPQDLQPHRQAAHAPAEARTT